MFSYNNIDFNVIQSAKHGSTLAFSESYAITLIFLCTITSGKYPYFLFGGLVLAS